MTGNTAVLKCQVSASTSIIRCHHDGLKPSPRGPLSLGQKIHLTHKSRYTNQKHGLLIKFAYLTPAIRMCVRVCVFIITGSQLHVGIRIGHRLGAGHRHASVSEHGHRWQVHCAIERRIVHK